MVPLLRHMTQTCARLSFHISPSCLVIAGWYWHSRAYSPWNVKEGKDLYLSFCVRWGILFSGLFAVMFYIHAKLQANASVEELRKKIWLVDSKVVKYLMIFSWTIFWYWSCWLLFCTVTWIWLSRFLNMHSSGIILQGLIVSSRKESLQHFKKPWAHECEPVNNLLDAIKVGLFSIHLCNL